MTTQLHNPANAIPAKGYRLLTVEEMTEPLPVGAMFWNSATDEWIKSSRVGAKPRLTDTYAVPVTEPERVTLTPFETRLTNYLAVYAAVKGGAKWQQCYAGSEDWFTPRYQEIRFLELAIRYAHQVRISPAPVPSEPVERTGWVNVYHAEDRDFVGGRVFESEQEANSQAQPSQFLATVQIKYPCVQREETRG